MWNSEVRNQDPDRGAIDFEFRIPHSLTGVLPGEQAVSKAARQGSTPCTGADCRRGSTEKGAGLALSNQKGRMMLVRIQSSALESVPML